MPFQRNKAKDLSPDEILAKVEHFCAYRERSPQETRRKLTDLGAEPELAEQIYSVLEDEGYINTERFAFSYARGKFRVNRWGKVRIRIGLRQQGIADALIQQALDDIEEEPYREQLLQLMRQKKQQLAGDPDARRKTAAYLIQAGFEQDLVFSLL